MYIYVNNIYTGYNIYINTLEVCHAVHGTKWSADLLLEHIETLTFVVCR